MMLNDRTIEDMLAYAGQSSGEPGWAGASTLEGWREPLRPGTGFRHVYDTAVGEGGWEFHQLNDALSIALVDFRAARRIHRAHRHDDHLVFCAVVEGRSGISMDAAMPGEELAAGFCTFYGLAGGESVHTVYEPQRALRYVSVFLRRDRIGDTLGVDAQGVDVQALPRLFRDHIAQRAPIELRQVPMGRDASVAAVQALECGYAGEFRRLFLIAKAVEIVCAVLHACAGEAAADVPLLRRADIDRTRLARRIIEENLGEPLSVAELAAAVGLTVKKLQHGFQVLFRSSVGQVYKQLRLSRAMALVSTGDMSMIDIAIECGYECPGSFTRAFKLAYGTSPSLVRTMALRRTLATSSSTQRIN